MAMMGEYLGAVIKEEAIYEKEARASRDWIYRHTLLFVRAAVCIKGETRCQGFSASNGKSETHKFHPRFYAVFFSFTIWISRNNTQEITVFNVKFGSNSTRRVNIWKNKVNLLNVNFDTSAGHADATAKARNGFFFFFRESVFQRRSYYIRNHTNRVVDRKVNPSWFNLKLNSQLLLWSCRLSASAAVMIFSNPNNLLIRLHHLLMASLCPLACIHLLFYLFALLVDSWAL